MSIKTKTHQSLLLFIFFILSCTNNSKNKSAWDISFGELTLKSDHNVQIGLNRAEFSGSFKEKEFAIKSDMGEVAYDIRDNTLWFAMEKGTEVEFEYANKVHKLAIADQEKINVKNDSVWIASYEPKIAEYGRQALVFIVFRKANGKWSKSYEDIEFMPWMNMGNGYGHGSQYNVSPSLIDTLGGRVYRGVVSFSMPGNWDLKFITFNDTLITTVPVSPQKD